MLSVSFFSSATDVEPMVGTATWSELVAFLADWQSFDRQRTLKKRHPALVLAEIKGPRRNENVVAVHGIAADIDTPPTDDRYRPFEEMRDWLTQQGWSFVLYTTTKSAIGHHRYRVVLIFEHAITPDRHLAAWKAVNDKLGGVIDPGTKDPARLSFLPANWAGDFRDDRTGEFVPFPHGFNAFASNDGAPVLTVTELEGLGAADLTARHIRKSPSARARADHPHTAHCPAAPPADFQQRHRAVLTDWDRSPYIADWMRKIADEPGQREFRFMCAVARNAIRLGLWIDADLLADIGHTFSQHGLTRRAPDDLARQAKNALDFAMAEPPQPEAGPRRSDTDTSTRNR